MSKRNILTYLGFLMLAAIIYYFIELQVPQKYIITIKGVSLDVEIANTTYLRKAGLMGRTHLGERNGILFMFPDEAVRSFWMKNTLIPLSIAFIRENGEITQMMDMQPDRWTGKLLSYVSDTKVKYALEVNQGWFQRYGIQKGDNVYFSRSIKRLPIHE